MFTNVAGWGTAARLDERDARRKRQVPAPTGAGAGARTHCPTQRGHAKGEIVHVAFRLLNQSEPQIGTAEAIKAANMRVSERGTEGRGTEC